jgi:PhnB protein
MIIPPGFSQVVPYIFADNADELIMFLVQGLGGKEVGRSVSPDGRIANSQIEFGSAAIMVSEASDDYPPSRAAIYLYVENADATMAQALEHGAKLQMEVTDMPYDDRQGGVVDPSGNIWWISQRLKPEPYFPT